jgi:hypothetical protein
MCEWTWESSLPMTKGIRALCPLSARASHRLLLQLCGQLCARFGLNKSRWSHCCPDKIVNSSCVSRHHCSKCLACATTSRHPAAQSHQPAEVERAQSRAERPGRRAGRTGARAHGERQRSVQQQAFGAARTRAR